jgi:hypothetical protein
VAFVAVFVMILALAIFGIVTRRRHWLARAVAVAGTRPDIGLAGFARLPAIARYTKIISAWRFIILALLAVRIPINDDQNLSSGVRDGSFGLYVVVLAIAMTMQLVCLSRARHEFDRLLATPLPGWASGL